ncbi:MAG: DNA methyltransferase, partial [Bacteroidota bacterium]
NRDRHQFGTLIAIPRNPQFSTNQPWGIFWIEFENRHLPVVVMRRILRALVPRKRASARVADRAVWNLKDLLFISSLGEHGHRRITFSHFREQKDAEPSLETFSWDERETHFFYLERLHMERLRWPANTSDAEGWRRQWASAFTAGYREPIRTSKELSQQLASLAARTRDLVLQVLRYERPDGPLHRLLESFQKVLIHDLKEDGFADMVSQTVAYGLFSARCTGQGVLGLAHLQAMVPNTNRFLKELFAELASISGHKKGQINFDDLGLSEMVDLLKNTNIEAVLEDFGRQTGGGKEDPVIHFYETFLQVYDKRQKVQRGVFYTPKPVVSFIVRSAHAILQNEFGLPDGLADTATWREMADRNPGLQIPADVKPDAPFVQILDPATGTGTFLEEVIDVVHKTKTARWGKQGKNLGQIHEAWNEYVPNHLLPRLHGFELMMAPYSVAHMKLGLKLRQTGYEFKSSQQLRVYLTNMLEPPEKGNLKLGFLPDFLSHESIQADLAKEKKPITLIIGNPPYSNYGQLNKNPWILELLNDYKKGLNEKKLNLDDDFIKFVRYSHWRIERMRVGVVGMITNHTYLDGISHRRMRATLMDTFNLIHVVDCHGSVKKDEKCLDGSKDENVFDIQQGVAISLLTAAPTHDAEHTSTVLHSDVWGKREQKYERLLNSCSGSLTASKLTPSADRFYFAPKNIGGDGGTYQTSLVSG